MKVLRSIGFCFVCLLAFFVTGGTVSLVRAKHTYVKGFESQMAYSYAAFVAEDTFLQYNQAGLSEGKTALSGYLETLQKIQNEGIQYPSNKLHYERGLAYLRLYRLETTANESSEAQRYLKSALNEFSNLPSKEPLSSQFLINSIESREAQEAKLYNGEGVTTLEPQQKP